MLSKITVPPACPFGGHDHGFRRTAPEAIKTMTCTSALQRTSANHPPPPDLRTDYAGSIPIARSRSAAGQWQRMARTSRPCPWRTVVACPLGPRRPPASRSGGALLAQRRTHRCVARASHRLLGAGSGGRREGAPHFDVLRDQWRDPAAAVVTPRVVVSTPRDGQALLLLLNCHRRVSNLDMLTGVERMTKRLVPWHYGRGPNGPPAVHPGPHPALTLEAP